MPTVFYSNGFRFFFYSNENDEPVHVHVEKGDGYGKIWLDPIESDYFNGFNAQEQRLIKKIVSENADLLKRKWYEYFR
ncbi:DUF4160 domain-containing protein [Flavobacterium sp.]|uniref:DUF4160 domain-containing protein n=1 Tax=Flavobacterium sp. TaxID=239 RepID=UPI003B9AA96D